MQNSIKGSYYIRVRKQGWHLWNQSSTNGNRTQCAVDKNAYSNLGFKHEMSVDEAKARCSQLNKENTFLKDKIRISAQRVTELRTVDETLFPQHLVTSFQNLLEDENFGTETQLKKMMLTCSQ